VYGNILVSYDSLYVELCSIVLKCCNGVLRHHLSFGILALILQHGIRASGLRFSLFFRSLVEVVGCMCSG
jgi:hypothetical protein